MSTTVTIAKTATPSDRTVPVVGSNQGKVDPQYIKWLRPTPRDTPLDEMRKRLADDGYLFVKGLLPREDVLNVRREYGFESTLLYSSIIAANIGNQLFPGLRSGRPS